MTVGISCDSFSRQLSVRQRNPNWISQVLFNEQPRKEVWIDSEPNQPLRKCKGHRKIGMDTFVEAASYIPNALETAYENEYESLQRAKRGLQQP